MATIDIEITDVAPGAQNTTISKGKKDRVRWWSKSGDWVVVFKGTPPFKRAYYTPGKNNSGTIEVEPGTKKYEYIVGINGKRFNSPWVKVDG